MNNQIFYNYCNVKKIGYFVNLKKNYKKKRQRRLKNFLIYYLTLTGINYYLTKNFYLYILLQIIVIQKKKKFFFVTYFHLLFLPYC
jgi:hypothetical protein